MKQLLVPVDGSKQALRAVKQAVELARAAGGEIHLINVQPPPLESARTLAHLPLQRLAILQREAGERVLAPAIQMVSDAGVRCQATVEFGSPAPIIADVARRAGCDSVVMGTRGLGAVGAVVLGSVANKVVHQVDVPVVLVK